MEFNDSDAQRLINIIDQRIDQRFQRERPHLAQVTEVDAANGMCSAYIAGDDYASPYIRYPTYLRPVVNDIVMVSGAEGARYLMEIFKAPGATASVNEIDGAVHLNNGADVTLTSTDHPLTIGPTGGVNMGIDGNEIVARNNGASSVLYLNKDTTGPVQLGAHLILAEMSAPGAPSTDEAALFLVDPGTGKSSFRIKFQDGSVVVIATQP